jgi:hypothetical protein
MSIHTPGDDPEGDDPEGVGASSELIDALVKMNHRIDGLRAGVNDLTHQVDRVMVRHGGDARTQKLERTDPEIARLARVYS